MVLLKENIIRGPQYRVPIYNGSIGQRLIKCMRSFEPERVLQVDGLTGQTWNAGQMLDLTIRTANGLKKEGMNAGDVAVFLGRNSGNIFITALATLFRNGVLAPIDPTMKVLELKHMFGICEPKFVFCDEHLAENARQALKLLNSDAKIFLLDAKKDTISKYPTCEELLFDKVDISKFEVEPITDPKTQLAYIISSSGSTGLPKGVGLTHHNMQCQLSTLDDLPPEIAKTTFMQLTQFYWVSGVFTLSLLSMAGARRVFVPKFDEIPLLTAIDKYKANWMVMSPAELSNMLRYPDLDKYDISNIKLIATAGAPLQPDLVKLLRAKMGNKVGVTQAYGMTEMTAVATTPDVANGTSSVGRPAPGVECKVIDLEDGRALGPMERGEFCFRGPVVMKCYVNNKEATKEVLDKDGWLHTGDLGYYDDDNKLYIVDRIKEFIKYRTWQVPPAELEALISTLSGVKEVAVAGVPHEEDIYHPIALVVKTPGSDITEEDIKKFVADNLSVHKQLRGGVIFVDALPRTAVGKLKRAQVKNLARDLYKKC